MMIYHTTPPLAHGISLRLIGRLRDCGVMSGYPSFAAHAARGGPMRHAETRYAGRKCAVRGTRPAGYLTARSP